VSFRSKKKENTDENNHPRHHCSHHRRGAFGPRSRRIEPYASRLAGGNRIREARSVSFGYECFGYDRKDGFAFAETERLAVARREIVPGCEKQREHYPIKGNFHGGHAGEEIDPGSDAEGH
jgi:hypothetical protein